MRKLKGYATARVSIKVLLLFFFFSPYAKTFGQSIGQPTDRDLEGLIGQVKSISEDVADIKIKSGNLAEGSRRPFQVVNYDRKGRMTRRWLSITGADSREQ